MIMRQYLCAFLTFGLVACGDTPERQEKTGEAPSVTRAALTFDGALNQDPQAQLAHGERMSWMFGCKGCHGKDLQGANVTEKDPEFGDMNASNLTLLLPQYSDAEIERVVRQGIPKDGREFWFMPSESFQYMSDADLAALIAYLRTIKPAGKQMPPIRKGPFFHKEVRDKTFTNARAKVDRYRKSQPTELGAEHALGRHIAMTVCAECHNSELQGYDGFTPDLDIAGAYSEDELKTLLATGKGKAKADLGLMTLTSQSRFSKFTPRERDAVVAYLKARAVRGE
jgi:mono/diheme cytochrome c family protein